MLTTLERLARAQELRDAVLAQESVSDVAKRVMFKRKEDTLRDLLMGRRASSVFDLDLFNPTDSIRQITEHLDSLAAADATTRITAAAYLSIVTKFVAQVASKTGDGAAWNSPAKALLSRLQDADQSEKTTYKEAQFAECVQAGLEVYSVYDDLGPLKAEQARLKAVYDEQNKAYSERYDALWKEIQAAKDEAFETYDRIERGELTVEQGDAIRKAYQAHRQARIDQIEAECKPAIDENKAARQENERQIGVVGGKVKASILAASIVTPEQATAWAAEQTIEPSARAALKKQGYPADLVRADMAEFYRLTAGRLPALTIRSSRGRASAEGIHGHSSSIINMGAGFCKQTLFHEMGHHLEADPTVLAAARGFLLKRRESETVYKLRDLTGQRGYGPKEVAYKDSWISPYVGKWYRDVTEVMSMGMESFCNDTVLTKRLLDDPMHFALMTGFMRKPVDPLFGSVKKVFKQIADAEQEVATVAEEEKGGDLARLAAGVEFVKDPAWVPSRWLSTYEPTYIGAYHGLEAYECAKLRDPRTKRKKRGWALIYTPPESMNARMQGWTGSGTKWQTYFESFEQVKAAAKVWAKGGGDLPNLTDPVRIKGFAEAFAS